MNRHCAVALSAALAFASVAQADADLEELSLEDLLKTELTSVARKPQTLADVPAAAFIISADDIRRSSALSLPEVLRMAPGVHVAQLDNGRYAVTSRGFNGRTANKLQVLVDGRSIYAPFFSGTIWEQDVIALEDIERIEVVRGPGAAMWGVNAVNGVINIISRHTRSQTGEMVVAGAGNGGQGLLYARHGVQVDEQTSWRMSLQGRHADAGQARVDESFRNDYLSNTLADFRFDHGQGERELTVWGNVSQARMGDVWKLFPQLFAGAGGVPGGTLVASDIRQFSSQENLMARYRWLGDGGVESSLQMALTHAGMTLDGRYGKYLNEERNIFDLDYQGRYALGAHDLLWGATHRRSSDDIAVVPPLIDIRYGRNTQTVSSVFLQDDWTLVRDYLHLGFGGRLDHSNRIGNNFSPNLSLLWTPSHTTTLWTKYARAPRIPARAELDASLTNQAIPGASPGGPLFVRINPSQQGLQAEKMEGAEIGVRKQFASNFSLDATGYRYRYSGLRSISPLGLPGVDYSGSAPYLVWDVESCNCMSGVMSGAELSAEWLPMPSWRLQLSFSWMKLRMDEAGNPLAEANRLATERGEPRHYGSLRSQWNLSGNQQLDAWLRGVGAYERAPSPYPALRTIPGYVTLDLRYAVKLNKALDFSLAGRNLIGGRRIEAVSDFLPGVIVDVAPSVFARFAWQF